MSELDVPFPSTTNYRVRRDAFISIPEIRRFKVCEGFPYCKDQFQVKYLEHFMKMDEKHDHLATLMSYRLDGSNNITKVPLHKKESKITPKELLPSWTDYERRAYVDHFYVLAQQHRQRYNTDNAYDACRTYDFFKLEKDSPFTRGFTNEFYSLKPKFTDYKQPLVFPLSREASRKNQSGYFYCHKRAEGP
ncbi:uncharacterized protein LOC106662558 [Cimex lectularius]|uniref:Uncharacterized protein n=1 Tax=Cimex lectularius TaxID=79782 RepID=A0A8I6RAC1_CIMLE|nr:uncharacterized protein LOC106662558 [Cimex lectularius]